MSGNVVFRCEDVAAALRAVAPTNDFRSVVQFDTKATSSNKGKFVNMWLTVNGVQGRPKSIICRATQKGAIAPPTDQAAAVVNAKRDTAKYGPSTARKKASECQIAFYPFKDKKKVKDDGITWEDGETPATPEDWNDFYAMMYYINIAFKQHIQWMKDNRMIVSAQDSAQGIPPGGVIHNNQQVVEMVQTRIMGENAPPEKIGKELCIPIPRCKAKFDEKSLAPKFQIYDQRTASPGQNGQNTYKPFVTPEGTPVNAMNIHEVFPGGTEHEFMLSFYIMLSNFGITCSRVISLTIAKPAEFNSGADLSMMGYASAATTSSEPEPTPPPQPNYSATPLTSDALQQHTLNQTLLPNQSEAFAQYMQQQAQQVPQQQTQQVPQQQSQQVPQQQAYQQQTYQQQTQQMPQQAYQQQAQQMSQQAQQIPQQAQQMPQQAQQIPQQAQQMPQQAQQIGVEQLASMVANMS